MTDPHLERRSRWLDEAEIIKYDGNVWIAEKYVYTLLDRELAFERRRCAALLCPHCKDFKPRRDRETNTFMHEVYVEIKPTVQTLKNVQCYADVIWRNEDQ